MKRIVLNALGPLVGALLAGGVFSLPAAAQTELKFGHVGAPGSLFDQSANEFAKRANEKLGNKAKVVVFGSSQLGTDEQMLQKLRLGTIDFALPSTVMSTVSDVFGLFEMPYLVKDREHMKRIAEDVFWPSLAPAAEKQGYKIIGLWENGFRHVTTNTRPIEKPEDLKGIKLRVPGGKWRVRMFQSYGANPSPMAFSELFVALQTGVMDGQENPLTQIHSSKLQEVQKFLSMTGHVYTPAYVTVGSRKWASLPADVRQVLEETARETQAFVYETAARMDEELETKLRDEGMQVNEVDKDAFVKASEPIYRDFSDEVPAAKTMVEKAVELGKSS
ncbi:TRAP transporter substrate-binding protein [Skermanella rosea]|uniref:TRAP transporter substrate-binding protein n=1 Tax=Skermanella rosea TaxID=1817965 RepID=UPI0019317014|nr:TRAP transporter substrate-binding protein [Skermanella rosea]UEM03200.1 TRAP transporter substrate-binding protein [Skermanella rosea]